MKINIKSKKSKKLNININNDKVILHGPRTSKKVALTFDDGPDSEYTPKLLDLLKNEKVPATFFVQGIQAENYPNLMKRIIKEGHIVGNHSYDHPNYKDIPKEDALYQTVKTNQIVNEILKQPIRLFRFPFGAYNDELVSLFDSIGLYMVNWDIDTNDWNDEKKAMDIVQNVKEELKPGSIILMHNTAKILPDRLIALKEIIDYIRKKGYQFVTLDQLLKLDAYFKV